METKMSVSKKAIKLIRDAFLSEAGHDLRLTDENVAAIVDKIGDDWDEMDDDKKIELLTNAEKAMDSISITDPGITALVNKIGDEDAADIEKCVEATIKAKATAVDVYAVFRRVYTKAEMDAMPYPGTDKDHVSGNEKPDIVKTKDNAGNPITTVWSDDFVHAFAKKRGHDYQTIIAEIKAEQKTAGAVPHLKGKGKAELASMLSDAQSRRNALKNMVKRAIQLHHKFEAVSAMPKITLQWINGRPGNTIVSEKFGTAKGKPVTGAPKPLWIFNTDDPGNGRDLSVTTLLSFDPDKALKGENGGNLADLIATAGTGAAPPPGETEATLDDFVNVVPDVVTVLNKRENMALLLKKVAPSKDEDDTASDDLLENVCSLYLLLKPIYDKNKKRYDALQLKDEKEEEAAA